MDQPPDPDVPAAQPGPAATVTAPERRRRIGVFAGFAVVALALDVVSKVLVVAHLADRAPIRLLGGALYVQEARNPGAAFSTGTSFTIVITAIVVVIVLVILRTARKLRSVGWAVALGLVLGGALGNLVDRLLRAPSVGRGHVVDWISVFGPNGDKYPIFNLADSAVCVGAVLIALLAIRGIGLDGTRTTREAEKARRAGKAASARTAGGDAPGTAAAPGRSGHADGADNDRATSA